MHNKGFTFIEIIVAISIMTVGIVGIYALVPRMVSIVAENTNKFIAVQLAREGIEVVRNIRDSNWLAEDVWDQDLGASSNYGAQYNGDLLIPNYGDDFIQLNANGFYGYNGQFGYAGGINTKFKREIIITNPESYILDIIVQITWNGRGSPFELKAKLYDWR